MIIALAEFRRRPATTHLGLDVVNNTLVANEIAGALYVLRLPAHRANQNAAQPQGVAYKIHNAFANMNKVAFATFMKTHAPSSATAGVSPHIGVGIAPNVFRMRPALPRSNLNEHSTSDPNAITFMESFYSKMKKFVNTHTKGEEKTKLLEMLSVVVERSKTYSGFSPEYLPIYINTMNYVFSRPPEFVYKYVSAFLVDSAHAYEGSNDSLSETVSCKKGIVERVLLCVEDAAVAMNYVKSGPAQNIDNIIEYAALINIFSPEPVITLFQRWWHTYCADENDKHIVLDPNSPGYSVANDVGRMNGAARRKHAEAFIVRIYTDADTMTKDRAEEIKTFMDGVDYAFETLTLGGSRRGRNIRRAR